MTLTINTPHAARSARGHRRTAQEVLRLVLNALRAHDYTAHAIRGFRSRTVFVILPDASQAAITVAGEGREVEVQHAYGRNVDNVPGGTVPAALTTDRYAVASYANASELTRVILSRLRELPAEKEGAHRDLPYRTLGRL